MARILDSISINNPMQKLVETQFGYIINGHYYDKATLTPKPLKLYPTYGDIQDLGTNQRLMVKSGLYAMATPKSYNDSIMVDNIDPTISYIITQKARGNDPVIIKIKEENGKAEVLLWKNFSTSLGTSASFVDFLGQNENYIFFTTASNATNTSYRIKLEKSTLISTQTNLSSYSIPTSIREDQNYIYYINRRYPGAELHRFNKITELDENVTSWLPRSSGSVVYISHTPKPFYISDNEAYTYSVYYISSQMKIIRHQLDFTKSAIGDIVIESEPIITWGNGVTQLPVLTADHTIKYDVFFTEDSAGQRYLNVSIYQNVAVLTALNLKDYGIYTFLINGSYDLEFKGFTSVGSGSYRGCLGVRKNTFLAAATDDSTIFLSFNEPTQTFQVTDIYSNQPSHIGVDQEENIWTVSASGEVDLFAPFIPTSIHVKYEKDLYKYEGLDIDSYVTLEAKNFKGTGIVSNVELTIKGDAVFTSNGSKVIIESTITTGPKVIPIKVKGAGNITVYPKLIM